MNYGTPSPDNLMLGCGMLYFNRMDTVTNTLTGERALGNCTEFTFGVKPETTEKYSAMDADRGLYKSFVKALKASGKVTMDEFDPDNVAMCLLGDNSIIAPATGTVLPGAGESFVVKRGCMIKLGSTSGTDKFGLTASTLVVTKGGVPCILNRDYIIISAAAGVIFIPDTVANTLTNGDTVIVSYTYEAPAIKKITGGTNLRVEGYLRFIGDPTIGPRYEGEFWRVSIIPEGDMPFIMDDLKALTITFDCQDDAINHPEDPFFKLYNY